MQTDFMASQSRVHEVVTKEENICAWAPNPALAALAEQPSGAAPRQNALARNKDRSASPMTQVMRSRDLENCDQSVPLPHGRKHVKGDWQVFVVRSADYYLPNFE